MNTLNNKPEEKKKGFIPFLSRIFGGGRGVSSMGSVGSAASKFGGAAGKGLWASIVSSKAGVVGLVLGAATIAAGIGVIYNYIGPSSSKVYTPGLFSNAYYEDVQKQANAERAKEFASNANASASSSLDMFKEVAQKELVQKNADENSKSADEDSNNKENASPEVVDNKGGSSGEISQGGETTANKLNATLGFDNKGAGGQSGSSVGNRLQTSGGLWGGIGRPFSPISRNANVSAGGTTSKMNRPLTARVVTSPKYTVPNINKKGAYGQAKYAANVSRQAPLHVSDAGARTTAQDAFNPLQETAGSGDIGTPIGGAGIGGAGLSQGSKLKANDPSLNQSEYTPPTIIQKKDDTQWKDLTDKALKYMLITAGLILVIKLLAKVRDTGPWGWIAFGAAIALAITALVLCGKIFAIGMELKSKYGQNMMGYLYIGVAAILAWQVMSALWSVHMADEKTTLGDFIKNGFKFPGAK
jgi:hypothetical protein